MKYFKNSYEDSRTDFLDRINEIKKVIPDAESQSFLMPPKNVDGMYSDAIFIPGNDPEKIIIMTSGIHGIEGYTGSAIQNMIIDNFILSKAISNNTYLKTKVQRRKKTSNKINLKINKLKLLPYSILFVHSINPYGHKYFRRVNENNVDLNRNFLLSIRDFAVDKRKRNKAYAEMADFLNPEGAYKHSSLEKISFFFDTLKIIRKNNIRTFKQAILEGQYEFPSGIFYGGDIYQPQTKTLIDLVENYTKNYKKVILIDIHTGYGKKGKLHLIGMEKYPDSEILNDLQKLYPLQKIEKAGSKKGHFYKISGAMFEYFYHKLSEKGKTVLPIAWEFGTNNNIKIHKSIESLRILVTENQTNNYGVANKKSYETASNDFKNLFYPDDEKWQHDVLQTSFETFKQVLKNLK